ncbi:hypothetical protein EVA_08811 [gut metagenome]|uniref:Uncharacterized protein n=1 Tax=gut metagenome TaxID=749906 RepID=J9GLN6_9ZZZZ
MLSGFHSRWKFAPKLSLLVWLTSSLKSYDELSPGRIFSLLLLLRASLLEWE